MYSKPQRSKVVEQIYWSPPRSDWYDSFSMLAIVDHERMSQLLPRAKTSQDYRWQRLFCNDMSEHVCTKKGRYHPFYGTYALLDIRWYQKKTFEFDIGMKNIRPLRFLPQTYIINSIKWHLDHSTLFFVDQLGLECDYRRYIIFSAES